MKNEKGFVFPFTLGVVLLSFFIISASVQIYVSEKKYLYETENYYTVNSINALTIKSLIMNNREHDISQTGKISFSEGDVSYNISHLTGDQYIITLNTKLKNGANSETEVIYNEKEDRMIKWSE